MTQEKIKLLEKFIKENPSMPIAEAVAIFNTKNSTKVSEQTYRRISRKVGVSHKYQRGPKKKPKMLSKKMATRTMPVQPTEEATPKYESPIDEALQYKLVNDCFMSPNGGIINLEVSQLLSCLLVVKASMENLRDFEEEFTQIELKYLAQDIIDKISRVIDRTESSLDDEVNIKQRR